MMNNFGKGYFMHIPFNFREKIEKNVKSDQQEPKNVVPQGVWVTAFHHIEDRSQYFHAIKR